MSDLLVGLVAGYVLLVLVLGALSARGASRSPDEYYLAGRRLGTLVLFMALFGTNATTFVLVGIPGMAYHDGVGIFSVNAPIVALGIPLTFWAIGSPARRMAARLGALTPAELYARRFGSPLVGLVLFVFFTLYTLPYMVQAVKGVGLSMAVATEDGVPVWAASLGVILVALLYTTMGGMRATAWTNVVQGAVFLAFMVAAFFLLADGLGGFAAATDAVRAVKPELLRMDEPAAYGPGRGRYFAQGTFASWGLAISLTVIAFPHMFARLMAAGNERSLKAICQLYPLALVCLWVPAVMLGVWGAAAFPELVGKDSDRIFSLMTGEYLPPWLGAVGQLALLAAVMSTLDAQILTLSSMLVRDVLDRFGKGARAIDEQPDGDALAARDVRAGRLFAVLVAAATYGLSLTWGDSLFDISRFAFSGYVTLVPALFLGVRWRRFTADGAITSVLVGNAVLLLCELGWAPSFGVLPVLWGFTAGVVSGVAVSLARPAADEALTAQAFGPA